MFVDRRRDGASAAGGEHDAFARQVLHGEVGECKAAFAGSATFSFSLCFFIASQTSLASSHVEMFRGTRHGCESLLGIEL